MGARGGVCGTTNINPLALEVYDSVIRGQMQKVYIISKKINKILKTYIKKKIEIFIKKEWFIPLLAVEFPLP